MSINPRTGAYEEWDIGMWEIDHEDESELDEILGSESDSEDADGYDDKDEDVSLSEFGYSLSCEDGDGEEVKGNGSPNLSDASVSPLAKYFNPSTSFLIEDFMEPASPSVPTWEKKLDSRIKQGRGLRAWLDWAVDRVVGRVQQATDGR